jgi:hypothetical protein
MKSYGTVKINASCPTCDSDNVVRIEYDLAPAYRSAIAEVVEAGCKCETMFDGTFEADVEEKFFTGALEV